VTVLDFVLEPSGPKPAVYNLYGHLRDTHSSWSLRRLEVLRLLRVRVREAARRIDERYRHARVNRHARVTVLRPPRVASVSPQGASRADLNVHLIARRVA
jgi:hypothetical protein